VLATVTLLKPFYGSMSAMAMLRKLSDDDGQPKRDLQLSKHLQRRVRNFDPCGLAIRPVAQEHLYRCVLLEFKQVLLARL